MKKILFQRCAEPKPRDAVKETLSSIIPAADGGSTAEHSHQYRLHHRLRNCQKKPPRRSANFPSSSCLPSGRVTRRTTWVIRAPSPCGLLITWRRWPGLPGACTPTLQKYLFLERPRWQHPGRRLDALQDAGRGRFSRYSAMITGRSPASTAEIKTRQRSRQGGSRTRQRVRDIYGALPEAGARRKKPGALGARASGGDPVAGTREKGKAVQIYR